MIEVKDDVRSDAASAERLRIVDCDVHHQFEEPSTLFPYLPRHYQ
ncbi:MAG: hypothetical protein R2873_18280 [Caldilineaceae bacterium]